MCLVQKSDISHPGAAAPLLTAGEIAYGLLAILLISPLVGILVAQLPLNPKTLAFGLGVVCTVPTALACGVAFVQVSKLPTELICMILIPSGKPCNR
jgi:predicted Na+-dependent transporter